MGRSRFVEPEVVTLTLSRGDYLQVKKRLNSEEARNIFGGLVKTMTPGEKIELDPKKVGWTKAIEYIVGWSGPGFVDHDGRSIPYSPAALASSDQATYAEIVAAIDAHETEQDAAIELEKNGQGGSSNSTAISPSAA